MVHSLRSMGSAALNIAMVASGGLDMYWEIGVGTSLLQGAAATLISNLDVGLAMGRLRTLAVLLIEVWG